MIQLNLLPAVKQEYIKAQRQRRLVTSVSILVAAVAVGILVIFLIIDFAQKKHLSDLSRDITSESQTLEQKPSINKILTVQNQLESLTALHASKPAASRLFTDYLNEVTPNAVAITTLHLDYAQDIATITGTSDALSTVNQYVDTLKLTTYKTDTNSTATAAFSNVVLSSFSLNTTATDPTQAANYTIDLAFDKNIFDITQNVKLSVPSEVTTRSQGQSSEDLFRTAPTSSTTSTSSGGGQ